MQPIEIILTPTFNKSLARLSPQDQKQVDLAVMQFWRTPDAPGLRRHSLDMREKRFHSISPHMDLRVIVIELCLILGDAAWSGGAGFGGIDDGDTIGELDAFDELGQLISPVQPAPEPAPGLIGGL